MRNQNVVMAYIYYHPSCTVDEISNSVSVNYSTICSIVGRKLNTGDLLLSKRLRYRRQYITARHIKPDNVDYILNIIITHGGGVSIAEISKISGISQYKLIKIIDEMIFKRIIRSDGKHYIVNPMYED